MNLGASWEQRIQVYRDLFIAQEDEPAWKLIRAATQQGVVVGNSQFVEAIEKRLGQAVQPKPRGRPKKEKQVE